MLTIASRLDVMNRLGRALADPTRSRIILTLLDHPAYPAELARDLDLTRPNVSNHLACLRDCGIFFAEPEGRRTRYEIAESHLAQALTALVDATLAVDEDAPCIDPACSLPGCDAAGEGACASPRSCRLWSCSQRPTSTTSSCSPLSSREGQASVALPPAFWPASTSDSPASSVPRSWWPSVPEHSCPRRPSRTSVSSLWASASGPHGRPGAETMTTMTTGPRLPARRSACGQSQASPLPTAATTSASTPLSASAWTLSQ